MNIQPMQDYLLIERDKPADMTAGGVALPDQSKARTMTGTVLAVGPGLKHEKSGRRIPMECKAGDRVAFGDYDGASFAVDGEDVVLVSESVSNLSRVE